MSRYFRIFAIIILLIILVTSFVVGISRVEGSSMYPTITDGEVIGFLRLGGVNKGDIVTIKTEDGNKLIKRIVAAPGDHVEIKNGGLYINDLPDNSFASPDNYSGWEGIDVILEENEYYVMGDNRDYSYDSRTYGVIFRDEIKGRVIFHFHW